MKVNIDKTMDDIVSISNQISGLKMLLDNKKHILSKYFENPGNVHYPTRIVLYTYRNEPQ